MAEAYDGRQVVGMDLHRRRSVLVRMTMDGRKLETARITNSPAALRAVLARCGEHPLVVLEATYGWYWAAGVLAEAGAEVHLAHPLGVKAFSCRRVKNDERDAADLADLARMGKLPEAWIAPARVRALREVIRYRHKLAGQRTSCKDQVHAVLAKLGVPVTHPDIFGTGGGLWLDQLVLPAPYAAKVASLRALIAVLDGQIARLGQEAAGMLAGDKGYAAVRELDGIGPVLAAVICAEIGDVTRFRKAGQLCSWAGLTPRHHESDTKVIRGHCSKQGSRMLRWALAGAVQHAPAPARPGQARDAIIARRGPEARNIAKTAAARVLLTQVFYALRDGRVRSAGRPAA
jgi:transposase